MKKIAEQILRLKEAQKEQRDKRWDEIEKALDMVHAAGFKFDPRTIGEPTRGFLKGQVRVYISTGKNPGITVQVSDAEVEKKLKEIGLKATKSTFPHGGLFKNDKLDTAFLKKILAEL